MSVTIFPETGDVITENSFINLMKRVQPFSQKKSGLGLSNGGGLVCDVASGEAVVNGYGIYSDATENVTCAANDTNYIWLEADGSFTANTTGARPSTNALLLGVVVTGASTITSVLSSNLRAGAIYARKSADQNVASSTTLTDLTDLEVAVEPSATYHFEVHIFGLGNLTSTDSGLKFGIITDTGTFDAGRVFQDDDPHDEIADTTRWAIDATSLSVSIDQGVSEASIKFSGVLVAGASAGVFKAQGAQYVSATNPAIFKEGSYIILTRLS